tara:strand:- start:303 stop:491 length:189 start_codon:yes stop_codon:yes gene_type:complete
MEEDEDLFKADLQTMLIVVGSYLYAGENLNQLEDELLERLSNLLIKHLSRDIESPPEDETIH